MQNVMDYLPQVRKALVATIAVFVVSQLQQHGVSPDMSVQDAVQNGAGALVSGLLVWRVSNKIK